MFKAFEGKYGLSAYGVVFAALMLIITCTLFYPKYNKSHTEATISWDVSGYYAYLPAKFIYHDLDKLEWMPELREKYNFAPYNDLYIEHESGNRVLKYSAGMAVMYSPAFFSAHILSPVFGFPQDGYSYLYQLFLTLQGLLVSIIGLIFLRKILIRYFGDAAACLTILLITLGTNFLEYGAITNAMSHNYLFMLYAILIYASIRFHESPLFSNAAVIGLTIGLMALARPTEIVAVLIPLLWPTELKINHLKARWFFIRDQWQKIALAAAIIGLIGSIQLMYWESITGSFLVYSYGDQGFSWLHPHIKDCLISFRAGWLIYTPLMLLSLIGFYSLKKKAPQLFLPTLLMTLVFSYISFSWDIWWYGGSLSQRVMVNIYPILAFPLCALLERITGSFRKTALTYIFIIFGVYMNFWLIYQAHAGGLLKAGHMTQSYYLAVAGRYEKPEGLDKLMDARFIFTKPINNGQIVLEDKSEDCLNKDKQFSTKWSIPADDINDKFLRFQVDYKSDEKEGDVWKMTQMIMSYYKGDDKIRDDFLRVQRVFKIGDWNQVWLDSKIKIDFDRVELSIWHGGSQTELCFRNVQLVQHKGK